MMVGFILGGAYILWTYQQVFLGTESDFLARVRSKGELQNRYLIALIISVIIFAGIYPQIFIDRMDSSVSTIINAIRSHRILDEYSNLDEQFESFGHPLYSDDFAPPEFSGDY